MIDLNCRGLLTMTYLCNYMPKEASSASLPASPPFAPTLFQRLVQAKFCAELLRSLNQSWWRKIHVVAVCPNPVETEFFQVAGGNVDKNLLKSIGIEPKEGVVATAIRRGKRKKDISLSCFSAHLIRFASRIFPHNWILKWEYYFLRERV